MDEKPTGELLAIYQAYALSYWSAEAFQAIHDILTERGEEIPRPADKVCPACDRTAPGQATECECGYDYAEPPEPEPEPKPFVAHCNLLQFQCSQKWELLEPLHRDYRRCRRCEEFVFICRTEKEYRLHAERGECVAITVTNPAEPKMFMQTAGIPRRPEPE